MKIAICDDEKVSRDNVVNCIEDYIHDRKAGFDYEVFESYTEFKDRIDEFNVFIMDYEVPEIDGMTFARMIREKYGENKGIIFVTSFESIVYETFEVRALRFLVKPLQKEKFYEALDAYLKTNVVTKRLTVKSEGRTEVVDSCDIYYIEVMRKDIYIYLENDTVSCRDTIDSIEKQLAGLGFFRSNRSFIVNLDKVKEFDKSEITLINGDTVPLSTRIYSDFKREMVRFSSKKA